MKRLIQVFLLALLASFSVTAQTAGTRANGIEFVASLPGTCNPAQGKTLGVVGTPVRYYLCTATNTWSEYAPGGSPGGVNGQGQYRVDASTFGGSSGLTMTPTQATITGGKFIGSLRDTNDNILIAPTATASAANYLTLANSASGTPPNNYVPLGTAGSDASVPLRFIPKGAAYPNGPKVYFPVNTRYDDLGISFWDVGGPVAGVGLGLKAGGAVFEITASTISFGANQQVQLLGPAVLAWGTTGVGPGGPGTGTANDDPPGTNTGIEKGAAGVLGFASFNGNTATAYGGGTWRARPNSPAQIVAQVNNYNPGAPSYFQRWSTDASRQVTGLTFSSTQVSGQVHQIWNIGAQDIVLVHESASSLAANRFLSTTGTNLTLTPNQCANALYDADSARWRVHLCN